MDPLPSYETALPAAAMTVSQTSARARYAAARNRVAKSHRVAPVSIATEAMLDILATAPWTQTDVGRRILAPRRNADPGATRRSGLSLCRYRNVLRLRGRPAMPMERVS